MATTLFNAFMQLLIEAQKRGMTEGTVEIGTRLSRKLPAYQVMLPTRICCTEAGVSIEYSNRLKSPHDKKIAPNMRQRIKIQHGHGGLTLVNLYVNEMSPARADAGQLAQHVLESLRRQL